MRELKQGLRETPEDTRDFPLADDKLGGIIGLTTLPKLSGLPEYFCLIPLSLKDQHDSDFCAAFSLTLLSEMQEGVVLSPEYQFALGKMVSGEVEEWGLDLRSALKSATKYGSLEQQDAPYTLRDKSPEFLRRFENWPGSLLAKIGFHKKKSFLKVTGPYDHFDNIRASIWKFRNEQRGVLSGLLWQWPLSAVYLEGTSTGFGHAIPYLGWSPQGLVLQNSIADKAGENGFQTVSRETVNHFVEKYKAYMTIDLSPEEAKYYLDHGIKLEDNWLIKFIKLIWR